MESDVISIVMCFEVIFKFKAKLLCFCDEIITLWDGTGGMNFFVLAGDSSKMDVLCCMLIG